MTSLSRFRVLSIAFCTALLLAVPAAAAKPAAKPVAPPAPPLVVNDECLSCHGDKTAKDDSGRSIAVDAERFKGSVHGEMKLDCTDCHTDVSAAKLPHEEKLKPANCTGCHEKEVGEYATTVHGKARANGKSFAASCADCHGTHDIHRSKEPTSPTNHLNLEATCSKCHGNDDMVEKAHLPGGNIGRMYHDSVHGKVLASRLLASKGPECTDCHGAHDIRAKSDPQSHVSRARVPETCGKCHDDILAIYAGGQHGKLQQKGSSAAPGCNDCHSAHEIQRHNVPKFQLQVIKECGNCHEDYIATYRDTFHGKVTNLGFTAVATCASCHGAHEMLPASNPASKVSAANRLKTCQACHADASANFATWDPHADKHNAKRNPFYYYTAFFMKILLIGVFAFFGVHTVLWFYRSHRARPRGAGSHRAGRPDEGKKQ